MGCTGTTKKPRLTIKKYRGCEDTEGKETLVLDMTFKQGEDRVQIFIKDINLSINKKAEKILIESARIEAQKYFKENGPSFLAHKGTVEEYMNQQDRLLDNSK